MTRKQIISYQGVQYMNYANPIPKQGEIPKSQRVAIIEDMIYNNELRQVGTNRNVNMRPKPKKKCLEWAYFDEDGNQVGETEYSEPESPPSKPPRTNKLKKELPEKPPRRKKPTPPPKRKGRPAKKQAMAEKMERVRSFKKKVEK